MFKKSDILPLILAFVSTILIVTMGFTWLEQSSVAGFGWESLRRSSKTKANPVLQPKVDSSSIKGNKANRKFAVPVLVPQGTSVSINGSAKLKQINQTLRRSFHQQYPGTIIVTKADGTNTALDLLYSRDIDLVALDRPLSKAEKAAGLIAVPINNFDRHQSEKTDMYYVYQEPLDLDTETFLGYALSAKVRNAALDP